tara:strand:+ start:6009 stop:6728 length:720 start_codon:yes stop_codon:yes gene_type:complete
MLIGEDFTKIRLDLSGIVILEPNAIISDLIMGLVSFYIAKKLYSNRKSSGFVKYWYYFFLTFGCGAILGSTGHGLFHYLGAQGKFPTWISGILSTYFIEKAMIKSFERHNKNNILGKIAFFKMITVFLLVIIVISSAEFDKNHTIGFLPIAINTIIGVLISVSVISGANIKSQNEFKWLIYGVLAMLPSAIIFLMKINLFQWLDKGDLSHLFMTIGIYIYFVGIKKIDTATSPFKTIVG